MLGEIEETERGFQIINFKDYYNIECSLQQSSLAIYQKTGTSAIWLGCVNANPRVLIKGLGWVKLPMPDEYLADTRMHLNLEQVEDLIQHLQKWVRNGTF